MATRTVVCPECESPLSPGRFSCSACGALVASVATVARSFNEPDVLSPVEVQPEVNQATQVAAVAAVAIEPRSVHDLIATDDGWDEVHDELDSPLAGGRLADEDADDRPLASAMTTDPDAVPVDLGDPLDGAADAPEGAADIVSAIEPGEPAAAGAEAAAGLGDPTASEPVAEDPAATEPVAEPDLPIAAVEPAWPDHSAWPPPTAGPRTPPAVLGLVGGPEDEADAAFVDDTAPTQGATPDAVATARVPAGVYLPPSAVLPPAEALPLPAAVPAPGIAPSTMPVAATGQPGQPAAPGPLSGIGGSLRSLAVPSDAGSRTIAIGGGLAILGFLLPWAGVVIGSRTLDGGLFSTWGLAGPAAPVALLLVLGLTALAVFRRNLPGWIGVSTPAIAIAALLVGILWPYLFGPFGATFGVYVVAAGAFVLLLGGLVERVASRHEDPPAVV